MPNCGYQNDSIKLAKISPSKKEHFLTMLTKRRLFVPSPDAYEVSGNLNMPDPKKRIFSKQARLTMAAEIIKKGATTPGPGSYRPFPVKKNKESHKMTMKRELGFINDARYKGQSTPQSYDKKYHLGMQIYQ